MKKKFLGLAIVVLFFWMVLVPAAVFAQTLNLSMVQPGDILLGRNPNAMHAWNNASYYTHAALVVSKNMTIETLGNNFPNNTVQGYSITNWINWFKSGLFTRVVILRVDTSEANRKTALLKAYGEYGKTYSIFPFKNSTMTKHSCCSLVWYAYRYSPSGIDLDYNGGSYIVPDDIALDNDIKYVSIQGY
ncbi:MAG: YiiX/YebB-like N1pC/P60 family cysteine hydrolase [bacterium]